MHELLNIPEVQRLLAPATGLLFAVWETMYMTVVSTLFAYVIGLPLGVLMVAGEEGGVMPLPRPVMTVLNFIINILRSVPFLILMVLVIPLSRLIIGTSIGTVATIIPLIVAAFPFVARLVRDIRRSPWLWRWQASRAFSSRLPRTVHHSTSPSGTPAGMVRARSARISCRWAATL